MIVFDANLIGPWIASQIEGMSYYPGTSAAIGRVRDGKIVAGVLYQDHNGPNVFCHIAVKRGGINRKFLSIIFDYPFNQLKVKRISAVVASSNEASRRFVKHLGFSLEANLQDAHPNGDLCIYKMTAQECRWLKDLPYESA